MMFQSGFGLGFVTGLSVGLVSRELISWGASAARPVAKAAIGATYSLAQKGKEGMHRFGESLEDLVAEAKAEYEVEGVKEEKKAKKTKRAASGDADMPATAATT